MSDLLDEVIEAHGGRRRWRKVSEINAHVRSGGLLMRSKLKHRRFTDYGLSVATDRQSAVLQPYPKSGRTGVYEEGSARILDGDGAVVAERDDARDAFFGLSGLAKKVWWNDLDALYFAGYAMWNYLNLPFLLERPGFAISEGEAMNVDGERWRRLDVTFPGDFHTHCREQSFYFDGGGLLRRHDYHPDVVLSRANAARLCDGHREIDGLVFPTSIKVFPKGPGGRVLPGPKPVWIELGSISVT